MSKASSSESPWDGAFASELQGCLVLVGLTFLEHGGEVKSQEQFFRRVLSATRSGGIVLGLQGKREGEEFNLPPDTSAFAIARPAPANIDFEPAAKLWSIQT